MKGMCGSSSEPLQHDRQSCEQLEMFLAMHAGQTDQSRSVSHLYYLQLPVLYRFLCLWGSVEISEKSTNAGQLGAVKSSVLTQFNSVFNDQHKPSQSLDHSRRVQILCQFVVPLRSVSSSSFMSTPQGYTSMCQRLLL